MNGDGLCHFTWSTELGITCKQKHVCLLSVHHYPPHECGGAENGGNCNKTCFESAPDDGDDLVAEHFNHSGEK